MVERNVAQSSFRIIVSSLPLLQLVVVIVGLSGLTERNLQTKFVLFVVCLVVGTVAVLISIWVVLVSTGFSHLISSTADFTLPCVR